MRDAPGMMILECQNCGLVLLDSYTHITQGFYESSGMHGTDPISMDEWLRETDWDDQRRFEMIKTSVVNKNLLDFGCGAGGFLHRCLTLANKAVGIELEERVRNYWAGSMNIFPDIESVDDHYDLITAFHVIEHLADPRSLLSNLSNLLKPNGRIIIEVPSSEDVLLTLYDCNSFQHYTYWSQHLFLFNSSNLGILARQAGFNVTSIQHYQRYPLSNHLYWLSQGKPGGHKNWSFLDSPELTRAYAGALASLGKTDTLIAHLERSSG